MLILGKIEHRDDSGKSARNLKRSSNSDDFTLTIREIGAMDRYYDTFQSPWSNYSSSIIDIFLEDGLISVGDHALSRCSGMTHATIPSSVETTEEYASSKSTCLLSVTVPLNVASVCFYPLTKNQCRIVMKRAVLCTVICL